MPHIVVEYTKSLSEDIPKLLTQLHDNLAGQDTINVHAVKTRAIPVQHVIVGDAQGSDKMIHITLKLLPGRSDDLKKTMAQGLFDTAKAQTNDDNISITAEVVDLHEASYTK